MEKTCLTFIEYRQSFRKKFIKMQRHLIIVIIIALIVSSFYPTLGLTPADPNKNKILPYVGLRDYYLKFKKLEVEYPFLGYGQQCGNPIILRDDYIEGLLQKDNLTMEKVTTTASVYERWKLEGGYRCDPSQFVCRNHDTNTLMWQCLCPTKTQIYPPNLGNVQAQLIKTAKGEMVCKLSGEYGEEPKAKPFECNPDFNVANLPTFYKDETVCAIYYKEQFEVTPLNSKLDYIESGLHYNAMECPDGKKCLIKEFDAECTGANIKLVQEWISKTERKDRLSTWHPCTCSKAVVNNNLDDIKDPYEDEIKKIRASFLKAPFGKSCDSQTLTDLSDCRKNNWYITPETQLDLFKKNSAKFVESGLSCDEDKGYICDQEGSKTCICKPTPLEPGYYLETPYVLNNKGYCSLKSGSDCRGEPWMYACPDGENCLIASNDWECTESKFKETEAYHKEMKLTLEDYLRRCYCTTAKIRTGYAKKSAAGVLSMFLNSYFYKILTIVLLIG